MTDDEPEPPTISELIAELESIREEEGDLPVVAVEEIWHYYPSPTVEEGGDEWDGRDRWFFGRRVEL